MKYYDIHPTTYIIYFMLIVSMVLNFYQQRQILELRQEIQPYVIRPNIQLYEKPDKEDRVI